MTTVDTVDTPVEKNYLTEKTGILSWLLTTDHKRIGLLYTFWNGKRKSDRSRWNCRSTDIALIALYITRYQLPGTEF